MILSFSSHSLSDSSSGYLHPAELQWEVLCDEMIIMQEDNNVHFKLYRKRKSSIN